MSAVYVTMSIYVIYVFLFYLNVLQISNHRKNIVIIATVCMQRIFSLVASEVRYILIRAHFIRVNSSFYVLI